MTHSSSVFSGNGEPTGIDSAVVAMHTVVAARHDDPLIAALDTVQSAVGLGDPGIALADFRATFDLS